MTEPLENVRTPIPPSAFSTEQAQKEIEKRHMEPLTPEELAELREMKAAEDGLEGFYLTERRLLATIATLTAERDQYKEANQTMHDAFMEVRAKLNAWDTPHAPSTEVIVACVSRHLDELVAERDALREDIKERDRTYLAVQQADGLEREKVEAERDALIEALQALVDEQNGPPLLKDVEYWEAAMSQAGEALGVIRTPIPPSVFSSEQARKEIEKRHTEPLTPETHSHGKAEPANSGAV